MKRREVLRGAVAASSVTVAGCSGVTGKDRDEKTTHQHVRSSTIRNGVRSDIDLTVFILDLFEKEGNIELLVSPQLKLADDYQKGTKQTTVDLVVNDIVDHWQQSWSNQRELVVPLSYEIGDKNTNPITIISKTEFEGGSSIETSRYEEIQYASDSS